MPKKSKIWKNVAMFVTLNVLTMMLFVTPHLSQTPTTSAPTSQNSAIRVDDGLIKACAEAVEELKAARKLIAAQKSQIETQERLLTIQTEIEDKLKRIGELSEREKDELRKALAAKDRAITSLESAVETLKKRKVSFMTVLKISVVAGAAGLVAGKLLK